MLDLIKVIEKNRASAENDPKNLLKFEAAKKLFKEVGPEKFVIIINRLLDLIE